MSSMSKVKIKESARSVRNSKKKYTADDCATPGVYLHEDGPVIFVDGDGAGWFLYAENSDGGGESLTYFDGGAPSKLADALNTGEIEPVDIKITYTKRKSL